MAFIFVPVFFICGCAEEDDDPPPPPPAPHYTSADLVGTWSFHVLTAGGASGWSGWTRGTSQIDANGDVTFQSIMDSDGGSSPPTGLTVSMDAAGVVSLLGDSSYHGQMSLDKDLIVVTMNDGGGGYSLNVSARTGGSFAMSDLAGTWAYYALAEGGASGWRGWYRGTSQIDSAGNVTILSCLNSDGGTTSPGSATVLLSADGTVTMVGNPTYHGTMSMDKNSIFVTMDDGGGGYTLSLSVRTGGTFALADAGGSWSSHSLVTGGAAEWTGWTRGVSQVDGNGTVTPVSYLDSDGGTTGPTGATMTLAADGTVGWVGDASYQGTMSLDKNLIILNKDDGGGGETLGVSLRTP
ncbi:MAG: hypothetical protein ACYTHM_17510 [Planctomycetota bacterium]